MYYHRFIENTIKETLQDSPVVLITGPRQAGKTTLAMQMRESGRDYVTLDDEIALFGAQRDPIGFIRNFDKVIIDEIQRAPGLFLTIKKSVDEDRRPGRFLLTGSANVLLLPKMSDSLVGRMQCIDLLPLARAEIVGKKPTFLDRLFSGKLKVALQPIIGDELIRMVMVGGFPDAIGKTTERQWRSWTGSYLKLTLTRDLKDIAVIENLTSLPSFIEVLATHSGKLVNLSQLAKVTGISGHTVKRYITLLEQVYLVTLVRPWYTNALKRLTKAPKLHFLDTGLLGFASKLSVDQIIRDRRKFGSILKSFVYSEILKLMTASSEKLNPYHFRENSRHEVDIVIKRGDGMIAGIDVKASATVISSDFKELHVLKKACGNKFACGIVLYDGTGCYSFGEGMSAVPLSTLWA